MEIWRFWYIGLVRLKGNKSFFYKRLEHFIGYTLGTVWIPFRVNNFALNLSVLKIEFEKGVKIDDNILNKSKLLMRRLV